MIKVYRYRVLLILITFYFVIVKIDINILNILLIDLKRKIVTLNTYNLNIYLTKLILYIKISYN